MLIALVAATARQDTLSEAKVAVAAAADQLEPCGVPRASSACPVRVAIALDGSLQSKACLLHSLGGKAASPAAWGLAAHHFPEHAGIAAHSRSLLRGQPCTPSPAFWDVLGPLPIGKNEVDADPLASLPEGSAFAHWVAHHNSSSKSRASLVASELVGGGAVGWRRERTQPDGVLGIGWPEMPWNQLVQALGQRAPLEVQAWAMGALYVSEPGAYLLDCRGVHRAMLYSAVAPDAPPRLLAADVYHGSQVGAFGGISLDAGAYVLALRVRTVVQARVQCKLSRATAEWDVQPPKVLPDLIVSKRGGEPRLCGGLVALAVKSLGAHWLHDVSVKEGSVRDAGARGGGELLPSVAMADGVGIERSVAPGQTRLLPLQLTLPSAGGRKLRCPLTFRFTLTARAAAAGPAGADVLLEKEVWLRNMECRTPQQSVVCTFRDVDGAVTPAGVIAPLRASETCDASAGCPVLLSLHGTSIKVRDAADAYKHKPSIADSDYTFGVEGFWLVAPSRHGAHNWEQIGRLSATRAVDALAAMPRGALALPVAMDATRVLFAGHSMGGHGAWIAAVQQSQRAIAIMSGSGWLCKETCKAMLSNPG